MVYFWYRIKYHYDCVNIYPNTPLMLQCASIAKHYIVIMSLYGSYQSTRVASHYAIDSKELLKENYEMTYFISHLCYYYSIIKSKTL